jgi:hypothetical protein
LSICNGIQQSEAFLQRSNESSPDTQTESIKMICHDMAKMDAHYTTHHQNKVSNHCGITCSNLNVVSYLPDATKLYLPTFVTIDFQPNVELYRSITLPTIQRPPIFPA